MIAATKRLCSAESCFSEVSGIIGPNGVPSSTIPHISAQAMVPQGGFRRALAEQSRTSRSRHRHDRRKNPFLPASPPGRFRERRGPPPLPSPTPPPPTPTPPPPPPPPPSHLLSPP